MGFAGEFTDGGLLRAIQSKQSKRCAHILDIKLSSYLVWAGLRQVCPLSQIMFVVRQNLKAQLQRER